jgi:replicative DNA helicase
MLDDLNQPTDHLYEMERVLCGVVTVTPWGSAILDRLVEPQLFTTPAHQLLWATMLDLYQRKQALTRDVLVQQLHLKRQLSAVGGAAYVNELPVMADYEECEAFTEQLLTHGALRLVHQVGQKMTSLKLEERAATVLDEAQQTIARAQQQLIIVPTTTYDAAAEKSLDNMRRASEQKGGMAGYDCGLRSVNNLLGGLQGGKVYIIAARPSIGKSVVAAHFARAVSRDIRVVQADKQVLIVSLEMPADEFVGRDISCATHLPGSQLERGILPQGVARDQFEEKVMAYLAGTRILFDDRLRRLEHISAKARRLGAEGKLAALFIDYVQLMEVSTIQGENRAAQVGRITRSLKQLAKDLDIPVVLLSQISRDAEKSQGRRDKRPKLSDLKESGSIEEDADVVILLYRPDFYGDIDQTGNKITGVIEFNVAKHRGGERDMVPCKHDMRCSLLWDDHTLPFDPITNRPIPFVEIKPRQGSLFEEHADYSDIPGNPEQGYGPRTISQADLQRPN